MPEDFVKELQRRRTGLAAADHVPELEVVGGTDVEEAVEGRNRAGAWLDIRPLKGPASLISYSELLQVDYDWRKLDFIALIFRHVLVTIRGRNLGPLLSGLQTKLAKSITQHDPKRDPAQPPDALVVDAIEFTYQRLSESVSMQRSER